jgi:hypothetical protein
MEGVSFYRDNSRRVRITCYGLDLVALSACPVRVLKFICLQDRCAPRVLFHIMKCGCGASAFPYSLSRIQKDYLRATLTLKKLMLWTCLRRIHSQLPDEGQGVYGKPGPVPKKRKKYQLEARKDSKRSSCLGCTGASCFLF